MDELLYEVRIYYFVVEQIKRNLWHTDGGTASFPVNCGGYPGSIDNVPEVGIEEVIGLGNRNRRLGNESASQNAGEGLAYWRTVCRGT